MDNSWSSSAEHHRKVVTWEYDSSLEKVVRLMDVNILAGQKVLDLGCGDGRLGQKLLEYGARVWGLDADEVALGAAKEQGIIVELGDLEKPLPYVDAEFDLVLCLDTLEHIYDEAALVAEIARVMAPTGKTIISIPNHFDIRNRLAFLFGGSIVHWAHKRYPEITVWGYSHVRFPRLKDLQELLELNGLYIEAVQYNFNSGGIVPRRITPAFFRRWLVATWPNLFSGKFVVRASHHLPHKVERIILNKTLSGV
jgi:methionine biosynthesis protein MetW